MRADQLQRLKDLEEKLIDVYLEEADPEAWAGAGLPINDMSKEERGDRYWSKKNGVATIALAMRTAELVDRFEKGVGGGEDHDGDVDKQIAESEKEAARLLNRITDPAVKKKFMDKTLGK